MGRWKSGCSGFVFDFGCRGENDVTAKARRYTGKNERKARRQQGKEATRGIVDWRIAIVDWADQECLQVAGADHLRRLLE